MTNKQLLIECISAMNTKSLENVLTEHAFKGYANVTFLEKLNEVFTLLKTSGNTRLEPYIGVGICSCNKDKKIFSFVGNKTNDYFSLSYQEDEHDYFNFTTSCGEVLYNKTPKLSKFYFFSINPKSTSEYKIHQESSNPIREYKQFSSMSVCNREDIELWLNKHKELYHDTVELLKNEQNYYKLDKVNRLVKKEFEKIYGKLTVLRKLYRKETYFMQQVEKYDAVKDSVSRLKGWFIYQEENKDKYQLFSSVFYDNRELTHFCLKFDELMLDTNDFKYALKYMSIIEDNKALGFEGTIKTINDLEFFEKTSNTRAYTKRIIVLSIDDFYCSEYQIVFTDGRVRHLDDLSAGQFVKVFARLTGGEWENSDGIEEYKHNLYGWRVETFVAKPKINDNKEDMDLYMKYMLPF